MMTYLDKTFIYNAYGTHAYTNKVGWMTSYIHISFKGLIIPGPILLSDKNPREQNTRGSCAPEGVLVTFSQGFLSDINI